jgi:hypothetical protein
MELDAPSVRESFGFAQDRLRSLPALIKASLRNQIGLFLYYGLGIININYC